MLIVNAKGGCIILLDVPPGSTITLDGTSRVTPSSAAVSLTQHPSSIGASSSSPFHRGLWIINDIPCSPSTLNDDFHLLVVRSGNIKEGNDGEHTSNNGGDCRTSLPVGFIITPSEVDPASDLGYQWILARRYDQRTEEISNEEVDELTMRNIITAMEEGGELHKFVISYDQFMGGSGSSSPSASLNSDINTLPSWDARTSLISSNFLQHCHGITNGNKIVPSLDSGDSSQDTKDHTVDNKNEEDGKSISYPPIPCIDTTINARQLVQHAGTRTYLSTLSPEKRTWLLFGANSSDVTESSSMKKNPGEFIWNDVLSRYYGRANNNAVDINVSSMGIDFLADIQLSFILFLFLECHASLVHWRDAISMCSLCIKTTTTSDTTTSSSSSSSGTKNNNMVIQHSQFFHKLLVILYHQLSCIETEFFQDVEYSSGDDNFMIGALRRLCNACECDVGKRKRDGDVEAESLKSASQKLRQLVRDRFGLNLALQENGNDGDDEDDDMETDALWSAMGEDYSNPEEQTDTYASRQEMVDDDDDENDDEEDGPVMIPYDQIEASLARSSSDATKRLEVGAEQQQKKAEYPLLFAAISPVEDEVMACARILDEAKDVSLVREAAAYLEEVEAHRGKSF